MLIARISPLSGKEHTLDLPVTVERIELWQSAADDDPNRFVNVAFPELSPDEREFLLTGITAQEWEEAFGDEDGDEDDISALEGLIDSAKAMRSASQALDEAVRLARAEGARWDEIANIVGMTHSSTVARWRGANDSE